MKKHEIIKSHKEFNNIIHNANFIKNNYFAIYYIENNLEKNRYGIAISKKFGKAYIRNYYKRITRNIIDEHKKSFSNNKDYIIMIKRTCLNVKYNELLTSFEKLLKEIK